MRKFAHILAGRKFISTFFLVSLMALLAKLVIAGKELAIASRFGRKDELDAFLIAFLIPSFVVSILSIAMSSAVMPVYIRVREKEGLPAARALFSSLSFLTLCLLAVLAAGILVFAPLYLPLIASGFDPAKASLTIQLIRIMTPFVVLSGMSSLWSAVLNAEERFAVVTLTPMLTPLLMIGLLFFDAGIGIYALAYAVPVGAVLELVVMGGALHARGFSLWSRRGGAAGGSAAFSSAGHFKETLAQFLPAIAGGVLMGSSLLVDQSMAAMLPAGSVAALSYGNKVIGFVLSILTTTIITVLTPYFSKRLNAEEREGEEREGGEREKKREEEHANKRREGDANGGPGRESAAEDLFGTLKGLLPVIFGVSVVVPVLIALFNTPIVKLVFYRGAFTLEDVKLVAGVQFCLIWQIPFYISAIILVRFIVSMRLNWILMVVAAFNLLINIVLNFILMKRMGVYGIALSTTFVHVGSLLLLVFFVYFSSRRKK